MTPGGPSQADVREIGSEPFVGRAVELDRLDGLLRQAIAGAGAVAFITGEAGIGKTALAREFLRRVRTLHPDFIVCRGRCVEQYGTGEAYLPFLDGLGTLLVGSGREAMAHLLRTYAPTWCLQLPAVEASSDTQRRLRDQTIGATKERMLREMGDLFEAAASSAPLVGLLEDVQWADPSSVDLLRHIGNRIARQRMLIVGTFRPTDLELSNRALRVWVHEHCQEIGLGAFPEEQVAAYLDARFLDHELPPDLAPRIHRQTDGHPLFVASLVRFLVERGDIARKEGRWKVTRTLGEDGLEAPEGVRDMIRRRIGSLGPEDQLALQHGSVMGRVFLSTVLAGVMGVDELALEERLQRLVRVYRLIDTVGEEELPDGSLATRYRFVHAVDREVLYDDLVSKRRIAIHRSLGEEMQRRYGSQAPSIAARLAVHFEQGRDFAAAVTYSTHAGDNAARLFAHGEAEEHYERAMRLAERLPPETRHERLVGLHQRRGAMDLAVGRFGEAAERYGRMLEGARAAARPELVGAALGGLCNALFFSHRIDEMAVHAEEALRAADEADSDALRLEAMLLVAQILQERGELQECRSLLDEVVALARSQGRGSALLAALTFRGSLHYWQSEYRQAEKTLGEAFTLASEQRNGLMVLACLMFLGLARGNLGRMSEALTTLLEAVETSRRNGDRFWLPVLASQVGWVHRELHDFERAVEQDQEALRIARAARAQQAEASALINLAMDYTRAGRLDEASLILRDLETIHSQAVWFGWLYDLRLQGALADHSLACGEMSRAEEHGRRLLDLAERHEGWTYAVTAHRVLAEAALVKGDSGEAASHLAGALDVLRDHPAPLEAWRVHATIGRVRSTFGAPAEAAEAYGQAWLIAREIAASADDAVLSTAFLDSAAVREIAERAHAREPS